MCGVKDCRGRIAGAPSGRTPEQIALGAAGLGALSAIGGLAASLTWGTPAGPSIVMVATLLFAVGWRWGVVRNYRGELLSYPQNNIGIKRCTQSTNLIYYNAREITAMRAIDVRGMGPGVSENKKSENKNKTPGNIGVSIFFGAIGTIIALLVSAFTLYSFIDLSFLSSTSCGAGDNYVYCFFDDKWDSGTYTTPRGLRLTWGIPKGAKL